MPDLPRRDWPRRDWPAGTGAPGLARRCASATQRSVLSSRSDPDNQPLHYNGRSPRSRRNRPFFCARDFQGFRARRRPVTTIRYQKSANPFMEGRRLRQSRTGILSRGGRSAEPRPNGRGASLAAGERRRCRPLSATGGPFSAKPAGRALMTPSGLGQRVTRGRKPKRRGAEGRAGTKRGGAKSRRGRRETRFSVRSTGPKWQATPNRLLLGRRFRSCVGVLRVTTARCGAARRAVARRRPRWASLQFAAPLGVPELPRIRLIFSWLAIKRADHRSAHSREEFAASASRQAARQPCALSQASNALRPIARAPPILNSTMLFAGRPASRRQEASNSTGHGRTVSLCVASGNAGCRSAFP